MDRPGKRVVDHAEVFVLTRTAERIAVRCDCPARVDHLYVRPLRARDDAGADAGDGAAPEQRRSGPWWPRSGV
jgi:hypothetical protein